MLCGTLTETNFERAPNGQVRAVISRDLAAGGVRGSEDTDVLQISSLQAGAAELVALRIYSPPLVCIGTFSLTDATRGEELMAMEVSDSSGI